MFSLTADHHVAGGEIEMMATPMIIALRTALAEAVPLRLGGQGRGGRTTAFWDDDEIWSTKQRAGRREHGTGPIITVVDHEPKRDHPWNANRTVSWRPRLDTKQGRLMTEVAGECGGAAP